MNKKNERSKILYIGGEYRFGKSLLISTIFPNDNTLVYKTSANNF